VAYDRGQSGAPDPATFIGRGKVAEIGERLPDEQIDCVLFDHALTPIQQRNLEQIWGVRVVERIGLISRFSPSVRAATQGKLQVELAQLQHQSTRRFAVGRTSSDSRVVSVCAVGQVKSRSNSTGACSTTRSASCAL
jgi:50S ribosomal subunit-associated GTPase HflX